MAKPVDFTENKSAEKSYKDSLYQQIFSQKKALLESYPTLKKGCVMPDLCVKYDKSKYTFKTTEVVDKVEVSHAGQDFCARYKKETGKYDVSLKKEVNSNLKCGIKYEHRQGTTPTFVPSCFYVQKALQFHAKYNPTTTNLKASCIYNANDIVKGVKVAADLKLAGTAVTKFNVGAQYNSTAGIFSVGYNKAGQITAAHHFDVDKKISVAGEACHDVSKGGMPVLTAGAGYKLDKEHELRVRCNNQGQLNACVKKELAPGTALHVGTTYNVSSPNFTQAPTLCFKITAKA